MPEPTDNITATPDATSTVVDTGGAAPSAFDEFKSKVEEIQSRQPAGSEAEPAPEDAAVIDPEAEAKAKAEADSQKFDETEYLKKAGFTQKSLEDIKRDLNKSAQQSEYWNWAVANIPNFGDFMFQQIMASRGGDMGDKALSLADIGKKPESPAMQQADSALLERFTQEEIDNFGLLAKSLGYVQKTDIEAVKAEEKREQNKNMAVNEFKKFGESEATKKTMTSLGVDWEKDVKTAVVRILVHDFGIRDFEYVNPVNIARAFNAYVMEQPGGMEKLLTNAKMEGAKTQEDKLKLGQSIPKTGAGGPIGKPSNLAQFLNDPKTDSKAILDRMKFLTTKR